MKLYHGSDKEIVKPIHGYGRRDCDYGSGFYMCAEKDVAAMWAGQYESGGFINEYQIDLKKLKVKYLNHNTDIDILQWITILCYNRVDQETFNNNRDEINLLIDNFLIDISDVDMIVGYRADDSYYQYTRAFLNNDLPIELLKKAMLSGKLGLQYVLISKKAFEIVEFVKSTKTGFSDKYKVVEETANNEYQDILKERKVNQTYLRDILREIDKYK